MILFVQEKQSVKVSISLYIIELTLTHDMNSSILTSLSQSSLVSRHYRLFKFIWMCCFILYLAGSVGNFSQLMIFSFVKKLPFDIFFILTLVSAAFLAIGGVYGLYCNVKVEKRKIKVLQGLGIINICFTLPFLFIIYLGVIEENKQKLLDENVVLYFICYSFLLILELISLLLNHKMNEFYKNFNQTVIRECLLLSNITFN